MTFYYICKPLCKHFSFAVFYLPIMTKIVLFALLLCLSVREAKADVVSNVGLPFTTNYTTYEYGGSRQNWGMAQAPNGYLYFANNRGIMEFDGKEWQLYHTLNESTIRSIHIDQSNGRIYAGSTNEFGYFEADIYGELKYNCLSYFYEIEECGIIWDIAEYDGAIYFISHSSQIFKYKDNRIKRLKTPPAFERSLAYVINNNFYLFDSRAGLAIVENDTIYRYHTETFEKLYQVYSMLPSGNKLLIGTRFSGMFIFDPVKHPHLNYEESHRNYTTDVSMPEVKNGTHTMLYTPYQAQVNNEVINSELYHGQQLSNGNYVYSTLKSGIIITDRNGNIVNRFTSGKGLIDNAVFCTFEDCEKNLWAIQDKGVTMFGMNDGFRLFATEHGISSSIFSSEIIDNKLIIGTTSGIYIDNYNIDSPIRTYPALLTTEDTYITRLEPYKENGKTTLLYCSLNGIFHYDFKTKIKTRIANTILNYGVTQHPADNSFIVCSHSNGISIFKKRENSYQFDSITTILDDSFDIRHIEFGPDSGLYVSTLTAGLIYIDIKDPYHIEPDMDYAVYNKNHGLPANNRNRWHFYNDTILITTEKGIYTILDKSKIGKPDLQIVPIKEINESLTNHNQQIKSIGITVNNMFLCTNQGILSYNRITKETSKYPFMRLLQNDIVSMRNLENDKMLITAEDIVLIYKDTKQRREKHKTGQLFFSKVNIGKHKLPVYNQTDVKAGDFVFNENTLTTTVTYPCFYNPAQTQFSFWLEGHDKEWTEWANNNTYTQLNLPPGEYTLHAKAITGLGDKSDTIKIHFIVNSPWYFSWYMWTIYAVAAYFTLLIIVRTNTKRLLRDKQNLEYNIKSAISIVERQRNEIILQHKSITDSIEYAKRIQRAVLHSIDQLTEIFPDNFVINMPKDIVSGDFFWCYQTQRYKILALADCTGHGVPGAFVSIIGANAMKEIIVNIGTLMPDDILLMLKHSMNMSFRYTDDNLATRDDMDIAVVTIDTHEKILYYSGANAPIYITKQHKITKLLPSRTVGLYNSVNMFDLQSIPLDEVDRIYMLSDGYTDQFSQISEKKLTSKRLYEVFKIIQDMNLPQQKEFLEAYYLNWKKDYIQIDDILIVGVDVRR